MKYSKTVILKNGMPCLLKNGDFCDGAAALGTFTAAHKQTDFLLTYPEENTLTAGDEASFLKEKTESPDEIEILAITDGKTVATAGIEKIGDHIKDRHRAEFGISVDKAYWGLGIGTALTAACIECARKAGYSQLELNVVSENKTAIKMYKNAGFVEFGRNPRGFKTKNGTYQELILMRLEF